MARPQSDVRIALAAELVEGPGTCRELCRRMGCEWPLAEVRKALSNMVAAGDASGAERVRVAGVRRPVPVYRRAYPVKVVRLDQGRGCGVHDLIACWAGLASAPRMGAAL